MTFMDDYLAGRTDGCTINDHIYEWQQQVTASSDYTLSLHEYLGMTWQQYLDFCRNKGRLPERGAP